MLREAFIIIKITRLGIIYKYSFKLILSKIPTEQRVNPKNKYSIGDNHSTVLSAKKSWQMKKIDKSKD